ncbi:MAG: Nicotinamidase [Nitrospira sp.]|jgi:nicotinamidase-related amidase|nr:MAG: Nicotinamidase [Nitrospira sp.]
MTSRQPDRTQTCLLIIDMINEFTFDGAEKLFPAIEQTAATIATLKQRAKSVGLPVLYVNDNFGKWRSDFKTLVDRCLESDCRGKRIAEILRPEENDYFVLKPKHSGFYATPLELLLRHLNIQRVVLTGVAGDNCVLFTAADAYMRNFDVVVPADCTVSINPDANRSALEHMRHTLKADTAPSKMIMDKLTA